MPWDNRHGWLGVKHQITYLLVNIMPWDNRHGWLGVKHQITYLLVNIIALGMFSGAKYTHHTFRSVTKQYQITTTANIGVNSHW